MLLAGKGILAREHSRGHLLLVAAPADISPPEPMLGCTHPCGSPDCKTHLSNTLQGTMEKQGLSLTGPGGSAPHIGLTPHSDVTGRESIDWKFCLF